MPQWPFVLGFLTASDRKQLSDSTGLESMDGPTQPNPNSRRHLTAGFANAGLASPATSDPDNHGAEMPGMKRAPIVSARTSGTESRAASRRYSIDTAWGDVLTSMS